MKHQARDLNLGRNEYTTALTCLKTPYTRPQVSVSEDVDAQINQDALAALKQLLEIQPQLHHALFTEAEHQTGALILYTSQVNS